MLYEQDEALKELSKHKIHKWSNRDQMPDEWTTAHLANLILFVEWIDY